MIQKWSFWGDRIFRLKLDTIWVQCNYFWILIIFQIAECVQVSINYPICNLKTVLKCVRMPKYYVFCNFLRNIIIIKIFAFFTKLKIMFWLKRFEHCHENWSYKVEWCWWSYSSLLALAITLRSPSMFPSFLQF